MGYCLILLLRLKCPWFLAEKFMAKFTWRGSWYQVPFNRYDEYKDNFDEFQVFSKSYLENDADTTSGKVQVIKNYWNQFICAKNEEINTNIIQMILEYSETRLTELVYQFRIWKDNFICGGNKSKLYGVGWNIKRIFHQCVDELGLNLKKISKNKENKYKFTFCILAPSFGFAIDSKHCTIKLYDTDYNLEYWWKWLVNKKKNEKYSDVEIDTQILLGFDDESLNRLHPRHDYSLPKWQESGKYPPILSANVHPKGSTYDFAERIKKQIFDINDENNPWIDQTNDILEKLSNQAFETLFDSKSGYRRVRIEGLTSETGIKINGLSAKVIDEYDFDRQRWPIQIISKEKDEYFMKCFKLKRSNLSIIE